jgi:hypothetical protein
MDNRYYGIQERSGLNLGCKKALFKPVIMHGSETEVPKADQTIRRSPGRVRRVYITIHAELSNKKGKIRKRFDK